MNLRRVLTVFCLAIICVMGAKPVYALNFSSYDPWGLGSFWTYQNVDPPNDQFTESVFDCPGFSGNPACYHGIDSNEYWIGYNDGTTVTWMANVDGGSVNDYADVSIGDFSDGYIIPSWYDDPDDQVLVRIWDNLDVVTRSVYNIDDSSYNNLILLAKYDDAIPSNAQNSIVESNLAPSVSPPNGGISGLAWYAPNIGKVEIWGVTGSTGDLEDHYRLIDYQVVPEPASLLLLGSGLVGMMGLRGRFRK